MESLQDLLSRSAAGTISEGQHQPAGMGRGGEWGEMHLGPGWETSLFGVAIVPKSNKNMGEGWGNPPGETLDGGG